MYAALLLLSLMGQPDKQAPRDPMAELREVLPNMDFENRRIVYYIKARPHKIKMEDDE